MNKRTRNFCVWNSTDLKINKKMQKLGGNVRESLRQAKVNRCKWNENGSSTVLSSFCTTGREKVLKIRTYSICKIICISVFCVLFYYCIAHPLIFISFDFTDSAHKSNKEEENKTKSDILSKGRVVLLLSQFVVLYH